MPWISKEQLIKMLQESKRGSTYTLQMLTDDVDKYERRLKPYSECDSVSFGLYDDYLPEYEYYVQVFSEKQLIFQKLF